MDGRYLIIYSTPDLHNRGEKLALNSEFIHLKITTPYLHYQPRKPVHHKTHHPPL